MISASWLHHDIYIATSYGIAFCLIAALVTHSIIRLKHAQHRLQAFEEAQQTSNLPPP